MSISTEDCKKFLGTAVLPVVEQIEALIDVDRGEWSRVRKYNNTAGLVARDFVNKKVPAVVTIVEDNGTLRLERDRPIFPWEEKLIEPFDDRLFGAGAGTDDYNDIVWAVAVPQDFRFCVADEDHEVVEGELPEGVELRFLIGFTHDLESSYDQELGVEEVITRTGSSLKLIESMEQCYEQHGSSFTNAEIKAELIRLGFTYDPKVLDND